MLIDWLDIIRKVPISSLTDRIDSGNHVGLSNLVQYTALVYTRGKRSKQRNKENLLQEVTTWNKRLFHI